DRKQVLSADTNTLNPALSSALHLPARLLKLHSSVATLHDPAGSFNVASSSNAGTHDLAKSGYGQLPLPRRCNSTFTNLPTRCFAKYTAGALMPSARAVSRGDRPCTIRK